MKLFSSWVSDTNVLPPDRLRPWQLERGTACLQSASGVPAAADACTFEPTQRLLAVGGTAGLLGPPPACDMVPGAARASAGGARAHTARRGGWRTQNVGGAVLTRHPAAPATQVGTCDGRVKLFGAEGVERTLRCSSGAFAYSAPSVPGLLPSASSPSGAAAPSGGAAASADGAAPASLDEAASVSAGGAAEQPGTRQLLFIPDRGAVLRVDTVRPAQGGRHEAVRGLSWTEPATLCRAPAAAAGSQLAITREAPTSRPTP
jgi:hypothetical protein